MKKDPLVFVKHIRDAILDIEDFTGGFLKENFLDDKKTQASVVRELKIIGEAARNIPVEFKNKYPKVNWKGMVGARDVIVHEYFGLNLERIWNIIQDDLPVLKSQVMEILNSEI